jgi:AraC-like DNA-binding protein
MLEDEIHLYQQAEFLAISVDLPVIGQIQEATKEKPYLCLQIDIDLHQLSDLLSQLDNKTDNKKEAQRGLFIGQMDHALSESVMRLARLLNTPKNIKLLAPLVLREFYYHLLNSEYAQDIIELAVTGSNMQRISTVIKTIKQDIAKPMRIEELAEIANMSPSSFHSHFKRVTAMSPLQYHKRLRLTEARNIMLAENIDASSTAYRVGYESPSQFSREYARMFGAPPIRDIENMRHQNQ